MKHRLISSAIALPLVLAGIFMGGIWFSFIIIFGAVVSAYELARITGGNLQKKPLISAILSGSLVAFVQTYDSYLLGLLSINIGRSSIILPIVLLSFICISILIDPHPSLYVSSTSLNLLFSGSCRAKWPGSRAALSAKVDFCRI